MSYPTVLTFLLLLSGFSFAQDGVTSPSCTIPNSYLFNVPNTDQDPCKVAAHVLAACNNGVYDIPTSEYLFFTPEDSSFVGGDLSCKCNTITYSLLAGCSYCRGGFWESWSQYSSGCTSPSPPHDPPSHGVEIPRWALWHIENDYWSVPF
ncbi:hypothetical protein BGW80DRAFT_1295784 [Lactifluus volemus]|nr:hypothetical protein BGW80DRAFT_1295784 [Lactifluus volemus]